MSINKLVDPGQVYIIGQYEVGTTNPTPFYKIGIVQNNRSSEKRVDEHQTGNPNRLFIAKKIECEASYMVEQQLHRMWNGVRIGKEWFNLSKPTDLADVEKDIIDLESKYGSSVAKLRPIYFATPAPGENTSLTAADRTRAEQIRDDAFKIVEQMGLLKYKFSTYECQIKLGNGTQPSMDSISMAVDRPESSTFKDTKLPKALRKQFMNKPRKNKDDFRFNFVGVKADIGGISLNDPFWKKRYPAEFSTWEAEKLAWDAMDKTIDQTTTNYTIRKRTAKMETLHEQYVEALDEFERLKLQLEVLELECKILCGSYEKIENVCTWKRASQSDVFNQPEFKLKHPKEFTNPAYYTTQKESVSVRVIPYKTYV